MANDGIKRYKPTSPGRRFMTVSSFNELTGEKPEKVCSAKSTARAAETLTAESPSGTSAEATG